MDILVYVAINEKKMPIAATVRSSEAAALNALCALHGGMSGKKAELLGFKIVPMTASPLKTVKPAKEGAGTPAADKEQAAASDAAPQSEPAAPAPAPENNADEKKEG